MKKEENDFLTDFLIKLFAIVGSIFVIYTLYTKIIDPTPDQEQQNLNKKLGETCKLYDFDVDDELYKFICEDNAKLKIPRKEIGNKQWESIKEKNHCKIISYDYDTEIRTWSCDNNNVIVENKFTLF